MEPRPLVGIRHETKSTWERRAPLAPSHVRRLVEHHGLEVVVQTSPTRVFTDAEYADAGARVGESLEGCRLVLGVKEIPRARLRANVAYSYFAHVIKGQPQNMPALRRLLELGCHLFDYERITDDDGRRLIFFGRYAGLAGALESLWALGQRLTARGVSTPFAELRRPYEYASVDEAKGHVRELGRRLAIDGIPAALQPLVIGVTGYGNVGRGAREILTELPVADLAPAELAQGRFGSVDLARTIVTSVFAEEHMVEPVQADARFELEDYYQHPDRYRSQFARYLPWLTVLVHCSYWDQRYPRVVTKADIERMYGMAPVAKRPVGEPRLQVIGDVSCDVDGGVEITMRTTDIEDPVFVYQPGTGHTVEGIEADGPVVMAIDFLPTELPADATRSFGDALVDLVPHMARADFSVPYAELRLPSELRRALITHAGELTPPYTHLHAHLKQRAGSSR